MASNHRQVRYVNPATFSLLFIIIISFLQQSFAFFTYLIFKSYFYPRLRPRGLVHYKKCDPVWTGTGWYRSQLHQNTALRWILQPVLENGNGFQSRIVLHSEQVHRVST